MWFVRSKKQQRKWWAPASLASLATWTLAACGPAVDLDAVVDGNVDDEALLAAGGTTSTGTTTIGSGGVISIDTGIARDARSRVVTVTGGSGADTCIVSVPARGSIKVTHNSFSATYSSSDVSEVVFNGGDGNDTFLNATSVKSTVNGGDGDDDITGGTGADFLVGGYGQDTIHGGEGDDVIWGSGGSDWLYGDDGDDVIKGHGGQDEIHGGNGNDKLYGGSGTNVVYGDAGNDTIVTIGAGVDTITGGAQWDNIWMDTTDILTDATVNENDLGYIHKIDEFMPVSYWSGGSTFSPIGKELDGADLPDPLPDFDGTAQSLVSFADHPLFDDGGPTKEDIFQGDVGDCYMMSPLSTVADATPDAIEKLVVDLGDGTYAVRFYRDGAATYVRVDGDLWVYDASGEPRYAKEGINGAIWVPIVEKAYAFFRRQMGTYASIASGDGTLQEHLNSVTTKNEITDGLDKDDIMNWVSMGSPAGTTANKVHDGVHDLLVWVDQQQAAGLPLYTGALPGISDATSINADSWRRGKHIYMIDHVNHDAYGNPVSLTLRDPYGSMRTLTDWTRIYYCVGRAVIWDMP